MGTSQETFKRKTIKNILSNKGETIKMEKPKNFDIEDKDNQIKMIEEVFNVPHTHCMICNVFIVETDLSLHHGRALIDEPFNKSDIINFMFCGKKCFKEFEKRKLILEANGIHPRHTDFHSRVRRNILEAEQSLE